jgi:hypothetical protein
MKIMGSRVSDAYPYGYGDGWLDNRYQLAVNFICPYRVPQWGSYLALLLLQRDDRRITLGEVSFNIN